MCSELCIAPETWMELKIKKKIKRKMSCTASEGAIE